MNTEGCWGFAFSTLTAKCDRCSCRSGNGHAAPVEPPARGLPHLVDERPVANPVVNSTRHTTFIHARWTNLSLPKRRPNQTARGRRLPGPTQALTAGQFKVQQASPLQMHRRRRRLADDDDEAVESLKTETETGQVAPRRLMPESQTPRHPDEEGDLQVASKGICMEQERVLDYVFVAREHKSRALQQHSPEKEMEEERRKSPL